MKQPCDCDPVVGTYGTVHQAHCVTRTPRDERAAALREAADEIRKYAKEVLAARIDETKYEGTDIHRIVNRIFETFAARLDGLANHIEAGLF
jgi:acyl-CoA reductase-like NAD-dependent aldehyde dehydrogenase